MPWWIIDARRNYSGVCARWRPVVLGLHRFFIVIARAVVNNDGEAGTSMDPMVWSVGSAPKGRRVAHAVRDKAFLPGPAGIWDEGWVVVAATPITCHVIELWPYSVSVLVKWVASLGTLHWPQGGSIWGSGVFLLWRFILYELWAGERLDLGKAVPPGTAGQVAQFQCRLFLLVQTLTFGDLAGTMVRYFVLLLHCLKVFVGANHSRLRHIGWKGVVMASPSHLVNQFRSVL